MKTPSTNATNQNQEEILWSTKPVMVKPKFKKWYSYFPIGTGLFEKVLVSVSVLFAIYNFIVIGFNAKSLTIVAFGTLFFIVIVALVTYIQKLKFGHANYLMTKDEIEIASWSPFGGKKTTRIDLKDISKTYLLGITENIGTILLYSNVTGEKSRDLMSGSVLETIAVQYVANPKTVKNLIDQHRKGTM